MNILVHSKSLYVTEAMRQYVIKQARKIGKFSKKIVAVSVFLETIKAKHGVEQESHAKIQIVIPGKDVIVSSKAHDLYLAISQAVNDASQSLIKRKERWLERREGKLKHFKPNLSM